ncbi:hypothetical protein EW146_g3243 [Bondarzewia mesenterica]|uniref:AB hydrolase-1 domain-containing protein n=1 Tax=Bondarzewia mesenterica TaxID=1095465 RepID=A0A4V3XFI1_9AGAM|nr:hypothetical protein EW146_g3243 [Bondarzewia mesenterica]
MIGSRLGFRAASVGAVVSLTTTFSTNTLRLFFPASESYSFSHSHRPLALRFSALRIMTAAASLSQGASSTLLPPAREIPSTFTASFKSWWAAGEKQSASSEERLLRRLPFFRSSSAPSLGKDDGPVVAHSAKVPLTNTKHLINTVSFTATSPSPDAPPPAVFLHGYGAGLGFYFLNFPTLAQWVGSRGSSAYALDWLGMGRSARVPFRIKAKRDDIPGRVHEAESFFCRISRTMAVVYALRYPSRVNKLVLLSPAGVPRDPNNTMPSREVTDTQSSGSEGAEAATSDRLDKLKQEQVEEKRKQSRSSKLFTYLWEEGWSPFQVVRSTLFWGPMLVGKYSSRRFSSLSEEETRDMHDYITNITLARGSGEYCISHILAPGAHARMPLVDRIAELKIPVTFVYGEHDWMDPDGGVKSIDNLRAAGNAQGRIPLTSINMAKGKKSKTKVYEEPDDATYIVITNPFGMKAGSQNDKDVKLLSGWIGTMFGRRVNISAVYTMSTRDYIIVQLPIEVNVMPILGAHKWTKFLTKWDRADKPVSLIFQYNYKHQGDPAERNWLERTVEDTMPPDGVFTKPYPAPSWATAPPQLTSINLTLPLPLSLKRTPSPPAETEPMPEEPEPMPQEAKPVKQEVKEEVLQRSAFVSKLDPYEAEEAALQSLRPNAAMKTESMGESHPVKHEEPSAYEAPSDVVSAYEKLMRSSAAPGTSNIQVKQEPGAARDRMVKSEPDGDEASREPSQNLMDIYARFQAAQRSTLSAPPSVKPEPTNVGFSSMSQSTGSHEPTRDPRLARRQVSAPSTGPSDRLSEGGSNDTNAFILTASVPMKSEPVERMVSVTSERTRPYEATADPRYRPMSVKRPQQTNEGRDNGKTNSSFFKFTLSDQVAVEEIQD